MKYAISNPEAIYELGKRQNQEDNIFPNFGKATSSDRLFILCDGMGGMDKGEVASATVADALSSYITSHAVATDIFTDEMFRQALSVTYDELDKEDGGEAKRMGTTLTFLYFHRGGCMIAHIGDSRIYHLRPATGQILYRSRDHSLVNDLYDVGEISKEQMRTSTVKNVITRAMQPHQETRSQADLVHVMDIKAGDYFYLCSDGMLEHMDDAELMSILSRKDLDDAAKRNLLVERTRDNADNHSAYIIHIKNVESESTDTEQPDDEAEARKANKLLNDTGKGEGTGHHLTRYMLLLFLLIVLCLFLFLRSKPEQKSPAPIRSTLIRNHSGDLSSGYSQPTIRKHHDVGITVPARQKDHISTKTAADIKYPSQKK